MGSCQGQIEKHQRRLEVELGTSQGVCGLIRRKTFQKSDRGCYVSRRDQADLKSPQEVPGDHKRAVSMERSGWKPE